MNLFKKLTSVTGDDTIEFLCYPEDKGIIPEPIPSRKFIPDWFKRLQPKNYEDENRSGGGGLRSSTIKRCPPFLDAMTTGWLIPLAADVEFKTNEDASGLDYKWHFNKIMVENHGDNQVTGNPKSHMPPLKWLNYWAIKVPPGWSVLFVPPLNRPNPHFECLSGFVDCDGYFEFVNFPFHFHTPMFEGIIPAGTPLIQAIPIKRDMLMKDYTNRPMTDEELTDLDKTRAKVRVHESHYRDNIWDRAK